MLKIFKCGYKGRCSMQDIQNIIQKLKRTRNECNYPRSRSRARVMHLGLSACLSERVTKKL